ncbi:MAG: HAD family phosphatase [Candidatus Gastranaerophilales bacterium]|nr:HAD family phosphatase [Candidatus Gastranaerophilales bacterium]
MKGIIFDFNGTLFFDSHLHYEAWRIYSKKLRGYEFTDEEMRQNMFGRTNADIIEYAIGKKPSAELTEKLAKEKEAMYRQKCLENKKEFKLAPGAENFLDFLKTNDIPRTIATMSEWDNVEFYIKEFQLQKWFDVDKIVYSNGKIPGKPAPDIYKIAAENIKLNPKDCIVVEDAISGINSAYNAGIGMIIAIASIESDELYKSIPYVHKIIHNYDEIDKNIFTFKQIA